MQKKWNNNLNYNKDLEKSHNRKSSGWIYIITNKAIPELIKIGYTTQEPQKRANMMAREGLPFPYVVEYAILVEDPINIEIKVHRRLKDKRAGKEWFRISPEEAVSVIKEVVGYIFIEEKYYRVERIKAEKIMNLKKVEADFKQSFEKKRQEIDEFYRNKKIEVNERYKSLLEDVFKKNSFKKGSDFLKFVGFFWLIFAISGLILHHKQYKDVGSYLFGTLFLVFIIAIFIREWTIKNTEKSDEYKALKLEQEFEVKRIEKEHLLALKKIDEEYQSALQKIRQEINKLQSRKET